MKNRKKIIIGALILIVVAIFIAVAVVMGTDSNKLTIKEKKWIDESRSTSQVISINVLNNAAVFGDSGVGVFYDFLTNFSDEYDIKINPVAYSYGETPGGISLGIKTTPADDDTTVYVDHYVLLSKNNEIVSDTRGLSGKEVGILASEMGYVTKYLNSSVVTYKSYDSNDTLYKAFEDGEVKYLIVPLHLNMKTILEKGYKIIYHFSDINLYFTLSATDDTFSSILKKYYNNWASEYQSSYDKNLFDLVVSSLGITETEIDAMRSINYNYGFINNSPYEVISSGNYGGVAAVYMKKFQDFSGIDINFTKYKNLTKFTKALNKGKIDIYFGYYNVNSDFNKTNGGINSKYSIILNSKDSLVVNGVNSLVGKDVYVDKNSKVYNYLSSIEGINIKTYNKTSDLIKFNKKDVIIAIDSNIYNYYRSHGLNNYTERYSGNMDSIYGFNINNKSAVYKLLNSYVDINDSSLILNEGVYNHEKTMKSGIVLSYIAKYFIVFLFVAGLVVFFIAKKTRKITIAKKIRKDDKLRFIDQLTMLKNRNYLHENLDKWSNNTIYPQAIIVVDLNNVRVINDTQGYEEGDKQIKAAANALIRNQLDNSDIIRTDGNEFAIYLVGYSQKQVTNYIHKLSKAFKKLPYNYGAEFGYSMILDNIKTVEDALNEATNSLKEQKGSNEKKN